MLSNSEIERYSRQLILPEFGVASQVKLKQKSCLIIGCGGLGCPCALYLATSGVGKLGLVDHDAIEISNIHRQIAHGEQKIGINKARNLAEQCKALNGSIDMITFEFGFVKDNAMEIIRQFDVIIDCTDNLITRYLINDCCVILGKPLISGGSLRFDGQLTIYNYKNGPCMRCIFPRAQSKETVNNCSDVGVLGPVVGTIGTLQALEAIKILAEIGECLNGRLLIFNGLDFMMRVIQLRKNKRDECVLCNGCLKDINSFDYNLFCGTKHYDDKTQNINILNSNDRISCEEYSLLNKNDKITHLLVDVRPNHEFEMCSLPNSINISVDRFNNNEKLVEIENKINESIDSIFVVCRRGNDSQVVVEYLKKYFENNPSIKCIKDLTGGLQSWHDNVDKNFPKY